MEKEGYPHALKRQGIKDFSFLAFSVAIGVLAALGALGFRALIELFQGIFWPSGMTFLDRVTSAPWWLKILVPACGGLLAGPIITFVVPEARGPGVPEVIVSVANRQSTMRHRVTVFKALVTSLLIGSGASLGREGPIVQIGSSIGSSLAQLFRLSPDMRRICLASGAAAGIAATFNAPIAGTLFAVEIILLDIEIAHISHIIISAVVSSALARIFWGNFPAFKVIGFELVHYWELFFYLLLGLLAGLMAIGFVRLVYAMDGLFRKLPVFDWIKPALGGLLLGCLALICPHVMGVGYDTINMALVDALPLQLALWILAAKMIATALCIGCGMSGGIFAPSLVLGSAIGTAVGLLICHLLPHLGLNPSDYVLAGMAAVVAGTTLAPITAILTIFELTNSYQTILPVMVSCIASTLLVKLLFGYSAYEMKLLKQGISIVRGHDIGILRNLSVGDYMEKDFEFLEVRAPLTEIVSRVIQSPFPHFVVMNDRGELAGVLSARDLKASMDNFDVLKDLTIAADLMTSQVVTLSLQDNLEKALELFEKFRISILPVMHSNDARVVVGILKKDNLLQAYREKVLKDRILSCSIK
ncbi:chloride channel protein [Desulforhabdus sp. TSK]|nr:chloride channel protein [Desulforhabdus sp. TSK]